MPIKVRHDVPAGIAALAGLMTGRGRAAVGEREALRVGGRQVVAQEAQAARQTQQLQAQRAGQMEQIKAQADRQREAADTAFARTALAAGLEENIQEQEFDNRMAGLQEQARIKANQFEYEFTTKDRNRIAKLNEGDQIMSDPRFNDFDRMEWQRIKAQELAGITPKPRPVDPNKQTFPPGTGPGILTEGKNGSVTTIDKDGIQKVIVRPDQTVEFAEMKHKQALELKKVEVDLKQADTYRAAKLKLLMETVQEAVVGGKGGEEIEVPKYTPRGADAFLRRVGYTNPFETGAQETQGPTDADLEQELQRRVDEKTWWTAAESQGMDITEEMRQAPPEIGQAMLYIQEAEKKYGNAAEIPANVLRQLVEADRRVKSYESGGP